MSFVFDVQCFCDYLLITAKWLLIFEEINLSSRKPKIMLCCILFRLVYVYIYIFIYIVCYFIVLAVVLNLKTCNVNVITK
jgi:hypothetical protein